MANPSNVAQEGVVGVDVPPEPSRSREGERAQGKIRGKSKAPSVDALESCVTTLEIALSAAQDRLERLEERVDGLEGEYAEFTVVTKALIQEQANTLRGEFCSFHYKLQWRKSTRIGHGTSAHSLLVQLSQARVMRGAMICQSPIPTMAHATPPSWIISSLG